MEEEAIRETPKNTSGGDFLDPETAKETPENTSSAGSGGRERSTIVFPYGDLSTALEVAKAIYNNSGNGADLDQLAEWMKHDNVDSGSFRLKIAAARIFGLISIDNTKLALLQLGRDTQDPNSAARALANAFLNVPLYRRIFETYRGRPLPDDKALEKVMESLGVAAKQTNRARQTFQRSATQAKVFNEKKDRLVLPAGVSIESKPQKEGKGRQVEPAINAQPSGDLSPALLALFDLLPIPGTEWSQDKQEQWLQFATKMFKRLYKEPE